MSRETALVLLGVLGGLLGGAFLVGAPILIAMTDGIGYAGLYLGVVLGALGLGLALGYLLERVIGG